jgi:hypothetical protein
MKLLIMMFSPLPCYLVPLRPKYSPQHIRPTKPSTALYFFETAVNVKLPTTQRNISEDENS